VVIVIRVVAGALLLAHGLVHLLYLAPDVPEFSLDRSWLLPASARRPVALALMAATVAAFALVARRYANSSPRNQRPPPAWSA
jgi:hypothetical protein